MSELAISCSSLGKSFKQFQSPAWRALDALGVPVSPSKYSTFQALSDVNLEIKRGEKVALIGRNGAGKSTLLRLIAGQAKPSTGTIDVKGDLQALMEIGTGFHPDFTGIENIRSTLALRGVFGKNAQPIIDEIIEFTELDTFIERPVREYSAGMYARLAFAASTAVKPDILIIDEILGTGDAYFVGKCIQRMKKLTSAGTTVLFVSHDMSSVQQLCDRGIWIEQGRIQVDNPLVVVCKLYQKSIRDEEERKLHSKAEKLIAKAAGKVYQDKLLFRLIPADSLPPIEPFQVKSIKYGTENGTLGTVCMEGGSKDSKIIIEKGKMNWSSLQHNEDESFCEFSNLSGQYIHAPFQVASFESNELKVTWLEITFRGKTPVPITLDMYDENKKQYINITNIDSIQAELWQVAHIKLEEKSIYYRDEVIPFVNDGILMATHDRYGKGPLKISSLGFFDENDKMRHTFISGNNAKLKIEYYTNQSVNNPVAVVAIYRPDGTCAMQIFSNKDGFQFNKISGRGVITVNFSPLYLGPGDYVVSVALFKELDLSSQIESEAYDLHDRVYPIKILPPTGLGVELGIVNQPVKWEISV